MIALKDRIYYTDPLVDNTVVEGTDRFLVLRERTPRTFRSVVGQIVTIDPTERVDLSDGVLWRIHDGVYVDGQPVSARNTETHRFAMAVIDDDTFAIGTLVGIDRVTGVGTLRDIVRSDGKALPEGMTTMRFRDHVPAADWARSLMPAVGDSPEAVEARVRVAERKYRMRFAQIEVLREAEGRGWHSDLDDLRGDADTPIPRGTWAGYVRANALLDNGPAEVPESASAAVERLRSRSLGHSRGQFAKIEVPVEFIAPLRQNDDDDGDAVSASTLTLHARNALGEPRLSLSSTSVTRLLRAAS